MKLRTLLWLLVAGYVVFLVAGAPAWLVAAGAATAGIQLEDLQGSVWRGAARARMRGIPVERIEWRFQPQRLALGELAYALHIGDPAIGADFTAARGLAAWRIRELKADLQVAPTARALAGFFPLLAAAAPDGALHVAAGDIAIDARGVTGQAGVQWTGAALAFSDIRPLGDYGADISLQGSRADFSVKTLQGPLRIAGRGGFEAPHRLTFNGEATAAKEFLPRLQGLLGNIGRPDKNGVYVIQHDSR